MQSTGVRVLIGAGMMVLALIFTGILAVGPEKRAKDRQGETCTPPKLERFRCVVRCEE